MLFVYPVHFFCINYYRKKQTKKNSVTLSICYCTQGVAGGSTSAGEQCGVHVPLSPPGPHEPFPGQPEEAGGTAICVPHQKQGMEGGGREGGREGGRSSDLPLVVSQSGSMMIEK